MFDLIFGEKCGGVWFYDVLNLCAILDGGIFLRLMLWTLRDSILVLCWWLTDVSRHVEVDHSYIVVPVEARYKENISFPMH